jgi:methyl-accepting chemotaxis protein-1 (serine sensor receptor)
MSDHEKEEAGRFMQLKDKFLAEALQPIAAAVRAGDTARATALVHGPMVELFRPVKASIDALIQIQLDERPLPTSVRRRRTRSCASSACPAWCWA